jgi:hypothetical protein
MEKHTMINLTKRLEELKELLPDAEKYEEGYYALDEAIRKLRKLEALQAPESLMFHDEEHMQVMTDSLNQALKENRVKNTSITIQKDGFVIQPTSIGVLYDWFFTAGAKSNGQ